MEFARSSVLVSAVLTGVLLATLPAGAQHNNAADANAAHGVSGPSTIEASVTPNSGLRVGESATFTLTLATKDGTPVTPADLEVAHTEKVHLLIIDPSLVDYHHEHPAPSQVPGNYTFTITPRRAGEYKIFADLLPTATELQEYAVTSFLVEGEPSPVEETVNNTVTVDGMRFDLSFDDEKNFAGQANLATLMIHGSDGKPFLQLEPVMGAFAHVVGFSADRSEIAHVHPMGREPERADERGGPKLQFHTIFAKPGYKKLFAQVQVGGRNVFAPFGLSVEADPTKDIFGEVTASLARLDDVVAAGKLDQVHDQVYHIQETLSDLPRRTQNLSDGNRELVSASLDKIKQLTGLLDKFGDAGDAAQVNALLPRYKDEIAALRKLIPEVSSADATTPDIKLLNNELCPISGQPVGSMQAGAHVDYKGYRVGLCCMGCEKAFLAKADELMEKMVK